MKTYRIAVYPGDGIGPEVAREAVRVLQAAQESDGEFAIELTDLAWGYEYYRQTGQVASDNLLEVLKPFDAILRPNLLSCVRENRRKCVEAQRCHARGNPAR